MNVLRGDKTVGDVKWKYLEEAYAG